MDSSDNAKGERKWKREHEDHAYRTGTPCVNKLLGVSERKCPVTTAYLWKPLQKLINIALIFNRKLEINK